LSVDADESDQTQPKDPVIGLLPGPAMLAHFEKSSFFLPCPFNSGKLFRDGQFFYDFKLTSLNNLITL
jgi:hypothetical protein